MGVREMVVEKPKKNKVFILRNILYVKLAVEPLVVCIKVVSNQASSFHFIQREQTSPYGTSYEQANLKQTLLVPVNYLLIKKDPTCPHEPARCNSDEENLPCKKAES